MVAQIDNVQKFGADQLDAAVAYTSGLTKGWQEIASEATDFNKKSFEKGRAYAEKLLSVKKLEDAFQIQNDYAKTAYEDFIAGTKKFGELYGSLTAEALKPLDKFSKTFTAGK